MTKEELMCEDARIRINNLLYKVDTSERKLRDGDLCLDLRDGHYGVAKRPNYEDNIVALVDESNFGMAIDFAPIDCVVRLKMDALPINFKPTIIQ
jgi:hypothetical protein